MAADNKPKVIYIFEPHVCCLCQAKTGGKEVTFKGIGSDGIERRFVFCASCIDGQPTAERCRELLRRTMGVEDAIARGLEEELIRQLIS